MNLFGTVLTHTAPSANYRGERAENRAVIQRITKGRLEYAIISPEAMRNALRETLRSLGLPCNRQRVLDPEQPAVRFEDTPDAWKYADDFFMGWLIAAGPKDRQRIRKELKDKGRNPDKFTFKRDSILRMNMAVALEPYRHDTVFTQSPEIVDPPWKINPGAQLLHRETTFTAFQYPFALNLNDCEDHPNWTRTLLKAIGQLNNVAGNHARSYFEMAPASIVVRLTEQLVAGFSTYGFELDENGRHTFPEVITGIQDGDYPGTEFHFGGKIVKDMRDRQAGARGETMQPEGKGSNEQPQPRLYEELESKGVRLYTSPQKLLEEIGEELFPSKPSK